MSEISDTVSLLQALIRCPSVTPSDEGAQQILKTRLQKCGFEIFDLPFGDGANHTENFFARYGKQGPHFCFAGHTDVVPAGVAPWISDPFSAEIRDGRVFGRGACDMKGGIAAFIVAVECFLSQNQNFTGSISFLITGDEEGSGINGTPKVLKWMQEHQQIPDFCIVGEPSSAKILGDIIKNGRRGSLNSVIEIHGTQGHVAYPHLADNPVHRLLAILQALIEKPLDNGNAWFQPSSVQITSVDVGNETSNLIPAIAKARLNIRFNALHTGDELKKWIESQCQKFASDYKINSVISGEAFITEEGPEIEALRKAINQITGVKARLDTGGGTSDARFISRYCSVAEFGPVGQTMHKTNESIPISELEQLTQIYLEFLKNYF